MYSLGRIVTFLFSLSSSSSDKYNNFNDLSLQIAVESFQEGESFFEKGEYRNACNAYMNGVLVGRNAVQKLVDAKRESNNKGVINSVNDDPDLAVDWLITSYIQCTKARMAMKDWQGARADAWAACSYSQNTNLAALTCMLSICENTNDEIGEIQTLKSIQSLIETPYVQSTDYTLESVEERIIALDKRLMERMS